MPSRLSAVALAIVVTTTIAAAQSSERGGRSDVRAGRPFTISLSGGAAAGGSGLGVGSQVGAGVGAPIAGTPFEARVDGGLALWSRGPGQQRVSHLAGNVVLPLRAGAVTPYAIAGVGAYAVSGGVGVRAGWNAGAGVEGRLAGLRVFTELRVHTFRQPVAPGVTAARRMTPLAIGFRF